MILFPRTTWELAELAKAQGKSVAEITRQAIDAGLEKLSAMQRGERMLAALEAARNLDILTTQLGVQSVDVPVHAAFDWATHLHQKAAYDGFYLATAEQLGAELWTADQALVNNARQKGASWVYWMGEAF